MEFGVRSAFFKDN